MSDPKALDRKTPMLTQMARRAPARPRVALSAARIFALSVMAAPLGAGVARAQAINFSHGGPITVTSQGGIEWRQQSQEVIADQDAKAVRGDVTVTGDQLIAHYRKKKAAPGAPAPAAKAAAPAGTGAAGDPPDGLEGNNEIDLLEAMGHVHIFTPTDQAWGDHGAYDMDQSVLVLTGHALKLTTPTYLVTARDSLEYWSAQHMAVARGDAVMVTNTGRRIAADVLVAYTDPSPSQGSAPTQAKTTPAPANDAGSADPDNPSGKLKRVDAIGHVVIMTATEIVQGDRAVYDPNLGISRIAGDVRITRGQNVLVGDEALVNMKTGISRLLSQGSTQVKGLIVPDQAAPPGSPAPGAAAPSAKKTTSPQG